MSVSNSILTRVLGVNVEFVNFNLGQAVFLPQRIVVIGQGNTAATYDLDKTQFFSAVAAANKYGYGCPIHLAMRQLFPENNDGVKGIPVNIIPLEDDGAGVVADGEITASGTATSAYSGTVTIGGIGSANIAIPSTTAADAALALIKTAIDSILEMPVTTGIVAAGVLPLEAKWKGESGNDISIVVSLNDGTGLTFGTTAFANGANNPDIDGALAKIGNVWETFILNCLNYDDTATADKYSTWNEGRWDQLVRKPAVVASGSVDDFATVTAITDARKTDRTNFLACRNVGSKELPFVLAARALAKDIVPTANDKPAKNYEGLLTGLLPGADNVQEGTNTADAAMKLGASTSIVTDGVIELRDTVTYYHPTGETNPAYRYVVDIVKLMNVLFNVEIILQDLKSNPLAPDSTVSADPDLVQPKDVLTLFGNLADSLAGGRSAIIVDPEFTKENATAAINDQNPKRLDSTFPVKLSGNVEVNSNDIKWGFYFGTPA